MIILETDFEYASLYKKGESQKEVLEYFWKKYQPLVKSVVRRYYQHHIGVLDFEDGIQNSFIYMQDCLEALKLNKIKYPERFSFGAYLKFRLRGATSCSLRTDTRHENKSIIFCNELYPTDHISNAMLTAMTSPITVEDQVFTSSAYDKLKPLLIKFYATCDVRDKKLFELCVDKHTSAEDVDMNYWVNKANFLKVKYSRNAKKTNGITKQYFYRRIDKLERSFIQFMQAHGYYSKSSLRANGLEKLS